MEQRVSESTVIAVEPGVAYDAVANVSAMGRWSPECTGADVKGAAGGEVRVGTRFTGRNTAARGRSWSTDCEVTAAERGQRFAFRVRAVGLSVAEWSYAFEPVESGTATKVTESWVDQRGRLMRFISSFVTGVRDRAEANRRNMEVTLRRLKEELEGRREPA
ncbi:SRPBCC family protein [Streptomyces sp. NPDC018031]|uniref:SRPBCC family protein n=1 Tax=Streptomyces sp. NPDC018031 TaxID=3365033 RepID=UPI00379E04E0